MEIRAQLGKLQKQFTFDTQAQISLTQAIRRDVKKVPNAYYLTHPKFETVISGGFVGDVSKGGACNCEDIIFNPHGNGTHTECVGHVSEEPVYMTEVKMPKFLLCYLIQAKAEEINGDQVVQNIPNADHWKNGDAVIINSNTTSEHEYFSGSNPCYLKEDVAKILNEHNIHHILTDLPSLDREEDGGKLLAHKAFFGYPERLDKGKTISELLNIPNDIQEGYYALSIEPAPIESDASPSNITLYPLNEV